MKKKIFKKLLAGALTAVMAFSLTACGGGDAGSSSSSGSKTSDAGSSDKTITVGFSQVGAESDWRTANTQNYQDVFSEDRIHEIYFL